MKTFSLKDARRWMPQRSRKANKGSCGRVYIVAGSKGMVGAGILSSWGAMKVGAGLVRLGMVASQQGIAARRAPLEVTTQALPESREGTLSSSAWKKIKKSMDVFRPHILAVGPGLGRTKSVRTLVKRFLFDTYYPLVLDADGINVLAELKRQKRKGPWIMTPHPGELSKLMGVSIKIIQSNRSRFAQTAARQWGCICVLKGAGTVVSDGHAVWKNTTGNPGMASGGTGDVLTGMVAGLWGQFSTKDLKTGQKAAALAVYLHGKAGDRAARKLSQQGLLALDLAEQIPFAIKSVLK